MKLLVTGGTGFVGQALLARLSAEKQIVLALVRRHTEIIPQKVIQVVGDLNDPNIFTEQSSGILEGVTTVVHCAALAHATENITSNSLEDYRRINRDGTLSLARAAANAKVKRFIFISSIGVNGKQSQTPFRETDLPAPHDDYSISKYEAEQGLILLTQETDMEVVIIRPPLVYGRNAPGNFATLVKWIKRGVPLPFGAVNQNRRSFIALPNLVDFVITCTYHHAAANQIFLISDGIDRSTADLLCQVASVMNRPIRLIKIPVKLLWIVAEILGKSGIAERLLGSLQIDITKAKAILNWRPPASLKETLQDSNESDRVDKNF